MKKVLIVGASGFIGANLARELRARYLVYGTYRRARPRIDGLPAFRLDITAGAPIEGLVHAVKPDVVVYCAGAADESICNRDGMATLFLNADAPALFAEALTPRGGQLIYLSTSKTFSGDDGDYIEDDDVSPRTTYGRAKVRGEELLADFPNTLSLRLGNVFGWGNPGQVCFLRRFLGDYWAGREIPLICDEYRNFIAVDEVARIVDLTIERELVGGPFHVSDGSKMSFYAFGRTIAKCFDLPTTQLKAMTGETFTTTINAVHRGADLSLDGSALTRELGTQPAPADERLARLRARMIRGDQ